jgi:hypothetical protein
VIAAAPGRARETTVGPDQLLFGGERIGGRSRDRQNRHQRRYSRKRAAVGRDVSSTPGAVAVLPIVCVPMPLRFLRVLAPFAIIGLMALVVAVVSAVSSPALSPAATLTLRSSPTA